MNTPLPFKHYRFSRDFRSAHLVDGKSLEFTKSEALALEYLANRPSKVVSRSQILDAISGSGSEKNDRNVDFVINRIRRKLDDSARNPSYIASRYGEGYVWVADTTAFVPQKRDVYISIGPIKGGAGQEGIGNIVSQFPTILVDILRMYCSPEQSIELASDISVRGNSGDLVAENHIEVTFVSDGINLGCILAVRSGASGGLVMVKRFDVDRRNEISATTKSEIEDWVPKLLAYIWKVRSTGDDDVPIPVAMHDGEPHLDMSGPEWEKTTGKIKSLVPDNPKVTAWKEANKRIKYLLESDPGNDEYKLMYASHLHSKYVLLGPDMFHKGTDDCHADEQEIEKLVLETLPFAQSQPKYAIISAKLLHFLGRGYGNLSLDIAEKALAESASSIASSLAVVGQLRGFHGRFDEGNDCLMQARQLATPKSDFHIYVLVLQAQLMLAAQNFPGLVETRNQLYRARPATMIYFEPIFTDPQKPSLRAKATVMMLSRRRALSILQHIFYIGGRCYNDPRHAENMMQPLVSILSNRFENCILTDEMKEALPGLVN